MSTKLQLRRRIPKHMRYDSGPSVYNLALSERELHGSQILSGDARVAPVARKDYGIQINRVVGELTGQVFHMLPDLLGKGKFGYVWKGVNLESGQEVAIKQISISNPKTRRQVVSELSILTAASQPQCHPHLVCTYDYMYHAQSLFVVMELIRGRDLDELFLKPKADTSRLTDSNILQWMKEALMGLQRLHQMGIIHQDIKPANMMLDQNGTVRLVDLGLGCTKDTLRFPQAINCTHSRAGSPHYVAPEIVYDEKQNPDSRSDVYSMGASWIVVILYIQAPNYVRQPVDVGRELLKKTHQEIKNEHPSSLRSLCKLLTKMTAWDPEKRPTVEDCITKIERLQQHL